MAEAKKVCSSLIEDMKPGIRVFLQPAFSPRCPMSFLPGAKRFYNPSDFRLQKAPKNVFQLIGISLFAHGTDPVLDCFIDVK
jgi:hypothetical protein